MEAALSSVTSVNLDRTAQHRIPENLLFLDN
jgi:hypothetical protein